MNKSSLFGQEEAFVLRNGVAMPKLGFGVWKVADGEETIAAVSHALEAGYRSIDTASVYGNERGVGQAIASSGIAREDIFITTKVYNDQQGYEETLVAFEQSCEKLGVEQVDLYLIHWAVTGKYKETWRALEHLYKEGKAKAIGVCNFQIHHLEDILQDCEVVPMVNQVELHPMLTQQPLREYCDKHGIQMEAWSPLMQGNLQLPLLQQLADKYNKTAAQIVLRWDIQHGIITIPKSTTPARIQENRQIFDFELSAEDMARIDALNENHRYGGSPDRENW
ncbi:aldo/keto reductase [Paenibacillus yanchengensis]|uniref:Aldo/keto reductase n=1 Tax=Paenibacillus yanchengensis TaxID=2035833 RepID=A0ABW4YM64_9BACL